MLGEQVVEAEGKLTLVRADGRHVAFAANADGSYTAVLGAGDRIVRNNGGFRLQKANRDLRDYDDQGPLVAASQAGCLGFVYIYSGNELSLIRDSLAGSCVSATAGAGRACRACGTGCSGAGVWLFGLRRGNGFFLRVRRPAAGGQGNLSRLVRRGSGYGGNQCGLELQPPSPVQGTGAGQRSFCTC